MHENKGHEGGVWAISRVQSAANALANEKTEKNKRLFFGGGGLGAAYGIGRISFFDRHSFYTI